MARKQITGVDAADLTATYRMWRQSNPTVTVRMVYPDELVTHMARWGEKLPHGDLLIRRIDHDE
jgi:hypothetical protein